TSDVGSGQRAMSDHNATRNAITLLVALFVGGCTGAKAPAPAPRGSVTPPRTTATRSRPRPAPEQRAVLPEGIRLVRRMSNPGGRLLSFGGAIYETVEAHAKTSPPETRLVRFEPTTGSIRRSAPFRGGTTLVVAGGTIWASGEPLEGPGLSTRHVTRLDPRSLTILSRVAFPAVPSAMAPSPAGLWVGAGNRLYLVHPEEASVLRTVGLHG